MRLLLDTHAFLWWDSEPVKLSSHALALCQDPENVLFLSVASVWEMQIKRALGKLESDLPLESIVTRENRTNCIEILPVLLEHVLALDKLPPRHKDPFDRLLIAQAITEDLTLLSADRIFHHYPVPLAW